VGVWKNRDPIPPWEWRGKRGKGGRTSDSAEGKLYTLGLAPWSLYTLGLAPWSLFLLGSTGSLR